MPEISRFYGISIHIHAEDHPPPHFHAKYAGRWGLFLLRPLRFGGGEVPRRVVRLVLEWARAHVTELSADWDRAQAHEPLVEIDPLE